MEVYVEEEHFKELKKKGIKPEYIYQMGEDGIRHQVMPEMNQFLILKADQSTKKVQLGRFDGTKVVPLQYKKVNRTVCPQEMSVSISCRKH